MEKLKRQRVWTLIEIIRKLNFSGILCIDEYKPKKYKGYDLIDSNTLTGRILYLEKAEFQIYMIIYLNHSQQIPESGNSENVIKTWRQMEKVRYGFKIEKGRLNHLKLYQFHHYPNGKLD